MSDALVIIPIGTLNLTVADLASEGLGHLLVEAERYNVPTSGPFNLPAYGCHILARLVSRPLPLLRGGSRFCRGCMR